MVNGGPGLAATKLSVAVEAIEALQAWKADLEALMKKTNTFLRLKINVLEEKVLEQAVHIKYLQEVLEIEVDEGDKPSETGLRVDGLGDVPGGGIDESRADSVIGLVDRGGVVKSKDKFEISKRLGVLKAIRVSSIYSLSCLNRWMCFF